MSPREPSNYPPGVSGSPWPNTLRDYDDANILVTLPFGADVPGAQHDDGVTAVALIDLARYVVDLVDNEECEECGRTPLDHPAPACGTCQDVSE